MRDGDETLAELAAHPGWKLLEQRFRERCARDAEALAAAVLKGGDLVDQRALDKRHGFWLGGRWVFHEVRLELAAYRAGAVANDEEREALWQT